MPTWSPVIAVALVMQAPVFTPPADFDVDVPVAASPCPVGDEARAVPRVSVGRIFPPRLRKQVHVSATEAFMAEGGDAKVLVSTVVDTDGQPCDLRIERSSHPGLGLEESSLDAVKQWRFYPATKDGAPVRHTLTIELNYNVPLRPQSRSGDPAPGSGAGAKRVDPLLQDSRPRISQMTPP